MIRKRTKLLLSFFIIILTVGLLFYLFSMQNQLPSIKKVENINMDSVLTEDYNFHNNNKIKVVAFMFTNCPDICPMTMVDLSRLQTELKETGLFEDEVQIVTITLDPEYDTEEVLKDYSGNFGVDANGWFMLRGTETETQHAADQFQMAYQKDENGMITHSTDMYLIDENDRIRSVHDMNIMGEQVDLEVIMENITRLVNE